MIFASRYDYKNLRTVVKAYPQASKIMKVTGGWAIFEFISDYEIWKKQK